MLTKGPEFRFWPFFFCSLGVNFGLQEKTYKTLLEILQKKDVTAILHHVIGLGSPHVLLESPLRSANKLSTITNSQAMSLIVST